MVKHLNGYKMSARNVKIQVSTFPGCSTLDMGDYLKPIIRKNPDKLVIHVGTIALENQKRLKSVQAKLLIWQNK